MGLGEEDHGHKVPPHRVQPRTRAWLTIAGDDLDHLAEVLSVRLLLRLTPLSVFVPRAARNLGKDVGMPRPHSRVGGRGTAYRLDGRSCPQISRNVPAWEICLLPGT